MNGGDHVEVAEATEDCLSRRECEPELKAAHMLQASRKVKSLWPYDLK